MNQDKFKVFSELYRKNLAKAVQEHPEQYGYQLETVPEVATRMLLKLEHSPMGLNYDSIGFKLTCKELKIKYTRKAILEYLEHKI